MPSSRGTGGSSRGHGRGSSFQRSRYRSRGGSSTPSTRSRGSGQSRGSRGRSSTSQRSRYGPRSRAGSQSARHQHRSLPATRDESSSLPPQVRSSSSHVTLPALSIESRYLESENAASDQGTDALDPAAANEIILAFDMRNKDLLGCAYYQVEDQALYLLDDVQSADLEQLGTILAQVRPTTVMASFQAPDSVIEYLNEHSKFDGNCKSPGTIVLRMGC